MAGGGVSRHEPSVAALIAGMKPAEDGWTRVRHARRASQPDLHVPTFAQEVALLNAGAVWVGEVKGNVTGAGTVNS